jgi:hypothetical protein
VTGVELQHVPYQWDGGHRCERCFITVYQDPGLRDAPQCDCLSMEAWTIALSHPAGYGERRHLTCVRCDDLLPASSEAGEPVAVTIFRDDAASAPLLCAASYSRFRLDSSPRCTGVGSG